MAEFVLGCVQLGLVYGAANRTGKPSHTAALRLLSRAVASGIQTYDVARAYGDAEDRLGEALSARPVGIITKLSPLSTIRDDASADQAVTAVETSIAASREALRRNRLDCLLLHRAAHRTLWGGAAWRRLLDYRSAGVITRLGISAQSAAEADAALADPDVQHIQLPFNLLDRRWTHVLALCAARPDVTVHVRSVFLQGLLAANDAALWPSIEGVDAAAVVTAIKALVRDLHRDSAADLCLAYVRGQPEIHGLVIGLETEDQLDANLALFAKQPLSAAECAIVNAVLPWFPEQLLNPALWPKK
jgi:spore coat polysaccharide biosynthesis protein SpsF